MWGRGRFGVRQTFFFVYVLDSFLYMFWVSLCFLAFHFLLMPCCLLEDIFHQGWNVFLAGLETPSCPDRWRLIFSCSHLCDLLAGQCNTPVFSVHCEKQEAFFFFAQNLDYVLRLSVSLSCGATKSWKTMWWCATQGKTEEHWCLSRELNVSEVAPILPHEFFQEIGDRMYCTTLLSGAKGMLLPMLAYHKYLILYILIIYIYIAINITIYKPPKPYQNRKHLCFCFFPGGRIKEETMYNRC